MSRNICDVPLHSHYLLCDTLDGDWTWALYQKRLTHHLYLIGWEKRVLDEPVSVKTPRATDVERDRFEAYPITDAQADAVVMAARHMTNIQAWHRMCERITQQEATS